MNAKILETVELETGSNPTRAVIWLHGLGADGHDFEAIVPALQLPATPAIRFVFPHAPVRPVTLNGGMPMRAWYDIVALGGTQQDEAGIRASQAQVEALIARAADRGIPANQLVLAGFSQGGAIALQAGLRHPQRLAGIMALSTWLPLADTLAAEASAANRDVPILMVHGRRDEMVAVERGERSRDALLALGYAPKWLDYPMGHEVCMEEVQAISRWLVDVLG